MIATNAGRTWENPIEANRYDIVMQLYVLLFPLHDSRINVLDNCSSRVQVCICIYTYIHVYIYIYIVNIRHSLVSSTSGHMYVEYCVLRYIFVYYRA